MAFAMCCGTRKGVGGSGFASPGALPSGAVIFIGGNQSSGKTSTCTKTIQEYFPGAKYISQDDPYGPDGVPSDRFSKEERHRRLAMFGRRFAEQGDLVFVDQVDYTHVHTDGASQVLTGARVPVQSVLLYLHLVDYPKRVLKRTSEGDARSLYIALKQYSMFFAGVPERPDSFLERISRSDLDAVFTALSQPGFSRSHTRDAAAQTRRRLLRQLMEASLHLDDNDTVYVIPRHTWDYTIDTSTNAPQDSARLLKDRVLLAVSQRLPSVLNTPKSPDPTAVGYYSSCNRCGGDNRAACAACQQYAKEYFTQLTGSAAKAVRLAEMYYEI